MKNFLLLLLFILGVLPQTLCAQAFKLEIRDQRVVTFDDGNGPAKEFHFKVYMSRVDNSPSPNQNLYLASANLQLNFNSENFEYPLFAMDRIGDITNYLVMGEILNGNILSISITPPQISNGVSTDAYNIALAPAATYIGDFFVTGIKENPGTMGLTWRESNAAAYPTVVNKFLEDGSSNTTDISGEAQFINPYSALLTDLHVHFSGDGTEDPNMYKIYVQSASQQELSAGSIGFYVYYSSSKATLVESTDSGVSGNPLNWGSTSPYRSVTVEEGAFADGYDRRFKYVHAAGATEGGRWPAFVDDPLRIDEGINIGALRFDTAPSVSGSEVNTVKFEVIDPTSFTNFGSTTNYTLTVDGPTRQLGTSSGTLPVTLTTFSAGLQANQEVLLKWATAMEISNKEFVLQRSANSSDFTDIQSVPGAGNSTAPRHYATTDQMPLAGTSYYRLKQVDFDGSTSFSKVVSIQTKAAAAKPITIKAAQPNPFQDQTAVHFSLPTAGSVTVMLSDATGHVIAQTTFEGRAGANTYALQGDQLAHGLYYLRLSNGSSQASFKLIRR